MIRILYLIKKEFIQTFRDRRMVGLIFIAPVFQLVIFGFAVTMDVEHIYLAVWDRDRSQQSRELVRSFVNSGYFEYKRTIDGQRDIEAFFLEDRGDAVLVIPPGFSKDLARVRTASLQVIIDGTNSNYATIVSGYVDGIVTTFVQKSLKSMVNLMRAQVPEAAGAVSLPILNPEIRVWYNPNLESSVFMVPGVICLLLMVITALLTSLAVIREREIGTIEHIIVTPIKPYQFILGKIAPFAIIGFIDVFLIILVGTYLFEVPVRGSVPLLLVASALFLFTTLGLGLFFSTISHTQQQAMFVTFMFLMPAVLLSGFFYPISNMPTIFQWLTYANPLRYFLVIIRGIFLKGNGIDVLMDQFVALAVFGVVIFGLSSLRFQKRLG